MAYFVYSRSPTLGGGGVGCLGLWELDADLDLGIARMRNA